MVGDCEALSEAPVGSMAFARPKSSTFTAPSARTLMFAGFKSRWMMPCSCAASRASATCFAIGSASSILIAPFVIRCDKSSPSTSSITRACSPAPSRSRKSRRCWDDSATRASSPRARTAPRVRSHTRTVRQYLDCDLAAQRRVGRAIHLTHGPFAYRGRDLVDAEAGAGTEGQV